MIDPNKPSALTSPFAELRMTCGPLGQQIERFLSLPEVVQKRCTLTAMSPVRLSQWGNSRTFLDANSIREVAAVIGSRG